MVATISGGGQRNVWDGPTLLQVSVRRGPPPLFAWAVAGARFLFFASNAAHKKTLQTLLPPSFQSFLTIVEVITVCAFGAMLAHLVRLGGRRGLKRWRDGGGQGVPTKTTGGGERPPCRLATFRRTPPLLRAAAPVSGDHPPRKRVQCSS